MIFWLAGYFGPLRQLSVYIGPSPRQRVKEMRYGRREKNIYKKKHHPRLYMSMGKYGDAKPE